MNDIYLGDSYDLVKRFWSENLRSIAPLFAHPRFVPPGLRDRFSTLTTIPMLDPDSVPERPFSIFLDPNTGIQLSESVQGVTVAHASLRFIVEINKQYSPSFMICFDQSYHRRQSPTTEEKREVKRRFLRKQGIASFYYISHAPFLFMAEKGGTLVAVRKRLIELGIPEKSAKKIRLQAIEP